VIGKPTGIDIKESKMTLPLIHALTQTMPPRAKRSSTSSATTPTKKKGQGSDCICKDSGGIRYATAKMNEYQALAFDLLGTFRITPIARA
jgi:octaprenyl-diphosphate synthase